MSTWNHYRYFLPFFPPVLVFAVVRFYALGSHEDTTLAKHTAFHYWFV